MLDSLNRRLRFTRDYKQWRPRDPRGQGCEISPRDIDIFDVLQRHGHSASHYLHELVGGEKNTFQKRLTKLYDWGYLDRFDEQAESFGKRLAHIIYGLTDKAKDELRKAERLSSVYDRTDDFPHRFMGACVGVSIEHGLRALGLTYISRKDVLAKRGNPLRIKLPHISPYAYLEPDDLFGIKYGEKSYRRFAVEIDRDTEPNKGMDRNSSIEKKFAYYHDLISNQRHITEWGISNSFMVLFVTTRHSRVDALIKMLKEHEDQDFASRFLFKVYPNFAGKHWTIPKTILTDILDPWDSVNGEFDITKEKAAP